MRQHEKREIRKEALHGTAARSTTRAWMGTAAARKVGELDGVRGEVDGAGLWQPWRRRCSGCRRGEVDYAGMSAARGCGRGEVDSAGLWPGRGRRRGDVARGCGRREVDGAGLWRRDVAGAGVDDEFGEDGDNRGVGDALDGSYSPNPPISSFIGP